MKSDKNNTRRDFLKKSAMATAAFTMTPGLFSAVKGSGIPGNPFRKPKVAFITTTYSSGSSHADVIGTKLFLGIPTDEGLVEPEVEIVSMWIDQIAPGHTGPRIAELNGIEIYPTITDALTLGGDELAVDAVIYVGEHGDYPRNRLGQKMYPRMNHIEQVFRVFDASGRSVPVFHDKHLSYSWLDSKWIYDRSKELNVPMMAGSSLAYCWRDPMLVHPLGTEITEAVAIGYATLDSYGHHVLEILQCMVERRAGGETGVASVQGLEGDSVWNAIDAGTISGELVDAGCESIQGRASGSLREVVSNPRAVVIEYNDGLKGAILMLDEYVNSGWAYAAKADGETVATEFVLSRGPIFAHFSYLTLNIQKFIVSGREPVPLGRNYLTSGLIDIGIRSIAKGEKVIRTPFLDIQYSAEDGYAILPPNPRPTGASIGAWPPPGYEEKYDFIIQDRFR